MILYFRVKNRVINKEKSSYSIFGVNLFFTLLFHSNEVRNALGIKKKKTSKTATRALTSNTPISTPLSRAHRWDSPKSTLQVACNPALRNINFFLSRKRRHDFSQLLDSRQEPVLKFPKYCPRSRGYCCISSEPRHGSRGWRFSSRCDASNRQHS